MGDTTLGAELRAGVIKLDGPRKLTRNIRDWLRPAALAAVPAALLR
jgi:hypothetical protein